MKPFYKIILFVFSTLLYITPSKAQQWRRFHTGNSALVSNNVTSLAIDINNKIFAGTTAGLRFYKNSLWQQIPGGISSASIFRTWTSNDSLWVGTEFQGLWGYLNNTWKNYDLNTSGNGIVGFGKNSADSIFRLDKFGTFSEWNGTSWTQLLPLYSQPNNLFVDRYDNVWLLSNNYGMLQYKNGNFQYWQSNIDPSSPNYIPSGSIHDMVQDNAGLYWIASDNGLLKFDGQIFQVFNTSNSGIASNRTRCLQIDKTGNLWIGTRDSGVSKFNGNSWVTYNVLNSPLTSPIVNDLLADSANNIWIANGYNNLTSPSNGQGIYILEENKDLSNGQMPNAPGNLSGKVISVSQVVLNWQDLSDNESGFVIERSLNDSLHFQQIKYVMNNTVSFNDQTVNDTTYYYRIRSVNSLGYSGYSNTIKVQPKYCVVNETSNGAYAIIKKVVIGSINKETPQCVAGYYDYLNLNATLFAGQTLLLTVAIDRCNLTSDPIIGTVVYIDWNGNGDFNDAGELIYFNNNINGSGEYIIPVTVPQNVTSGTITRMRIRAEDDVYINPIAPCNYAETTQDYTITITDPPVLFNPDHLSASTLTSSKILLRWQDNAFDEIRYEVYRSLDSLSFSLVTQLPANSVQYTDSLLQADTKYYYRITAVKTTVSGESQVFNSRTLSADLVRQFTGDITTDAAFNAGAYWGDFDNDSKYDLYVTGSNKLYVNQNNILNNSQFNFHNSSSAAWADFDNDGDQDIFIGDYLYGGGPSVAYLYENNGGAAFNPLSIITQDGRINNIAWTDYNSDGYLDIYISYLDLNYGKLYRNNGNKTFSMVRKFDNAGGYASFADYDSDGDDDLFVLSSPQSKLFNLQDSIFTANTTSSLALIPGNFKGCSWADYDNDGDPDLFVANSNPTVPNYSRLYTNKGMGTFATSIVTMVDGSAYGSAWGDYDNDGNQDLFVSRLQKTNKLFRIVNGVLNEQPESVFVNEDFSLPPYNLLSSMGCAWGDFNNDGFLDIYVAQSAGYPSRLYKNSTNQNKWLNIKLAGITSNKNGIGAFIKLKVNGKWQYRWIQSTSGFGGENSIASEFGLGLATSVDSLIVRWPSNVVQLLTNVMPNQFLTITEDNPCNTLSTWTGAVSNAWEDPGNWNCAAVPNVNSGVTIPAGALVFLNSNVSIRSLKVSTGATLTINNNNAITIIPW